MPSEQTLLMCAPEFYGVDYVINPWMDGNLGKIDHALAVRQWDTLYNTFCEHVPVKLVTPQKGLPDMVFTANAGVVLNNRVIASRFREEERQGEEPYFTKWFEENGFDLADWPQNVSFEGAGDALLDRKEHRFWLGHGFRTDPEAKDLLEEIYGLPVIPLRLQDPRFYHLDTCFCPLEGGHTLCYLPAFTEESQDKIKKTLPAELLIEVSEEDAFGFACNAVDLNGHVFLNHATEKLQDRLAAAGFKTIITPLSEYMKSGGAAKCLTLKLIEP